MRSRTHDGASVPGATGQRRFTRAELDGLWVHDDITLRLTDDLAADIPEDDRGPQSALPHWAGHAPAEGAAIAVWHMLAPPPGVDNTLPSWLRKQGISWFRGWIRHAGTEGPDFVMDWVILLNDGTYVTARDGDTGPYSPPAGCDLPTFVEAVASLSRDFMLDDLGRKMRLLQDAGKLRGPRLPSKSRLDLWVEVLEAAEREAGGKGEPG